MPKTITEIQVFVASPGDLEKERDLLATVIDELNRHWIPTLGAHLRLLRWETDVHPGFGADPQDIINEQIGEDYDIFIGILWGGFGTKTPRAGSGTMEEFERALARRRSGSKYPEIMVYFKDTPIALTKIDTEQLRKIQAFRAELPKVGIIYADFSDESGFATALRGHLASVVRKFLNQPLGENRTSQIITDIAEDEEDLGFLDYIEIYEARIADMSSTMASITETTERMAEDFTRRTAEASEFGKSGGRTDIKAAKRVIKRAAEDMNSFGRNLEAQLLLLSPARDEALTSLTKALALYGEFGEVVPDQTSELQRSLAGFGAASCGARIGLASFRHAIASMPRMTSDLNKAKKYVVRKLDDMDAEIERAEIASTNVLESIDRMLAA